MKIRFAMLGLFGLNLSLLGACQRPLPAMNTPASVLTQRAAQPTAQAAINGARQTPGEILEAGVIAIRKARFASLDKNADARLVVGEVRDLDLRLPGVITGFKDYDADQNGEIILSEYLHAGVLSFYRAFYDSIIEDNFFLSDLNRDRVLTGDERNELNQKLRPWPELNGGDQDGDQMIDYLEYLKGYLHAEAHK